MRAVYPDYVEGYNGGRISFRNSFCLSWRYKDCCYFLLRIYVSWSVKDVFVVVLLSVLLCGVIIYIILIYCPHAKGYKIDRAYSQHFKTQFSKPHFLLLSNREYHSSHWTYPAWIKSRRYSERCRKRSKRVIVIYPKWWVRENTDGTYFNEEKIKSPKAP